MKSTPDLGPPIVERFSRAEIVHLLRTKYGVSQERAREAARIAAPNEKPAQKTSKPETSAKKLARAFRRYCADQGVSLPVPEWQFDDERRWRLDFAWPEALVALEVHGGTWSGGRHTRGKGFREDREKVNAAKKLGWTVIEVPTDKVYSLDTLDLIRHALTTR